MASTEKIKGFEDFLGEDAKKREKIIEIIRKQYELYGFEPAETPIIESEDFVKGNNERDSAVRDIFKLEDRGKRKLALRFEFTFQLKRIAKNQKLPYKRYQIGYNFRDEPVREGRLRQFIQCDADIIGSSLKEEAELMSIFKKVFEELKIPATIYLNNRKLINEILESEGIVERNREQVIRELDKLDKLSKEEVAKNLKEFQAEKLVNIFTGKPNTFEKYAYYKEIQKLKELCKSYGVEVEFRPFLARGLSYYNGSVFECWSKEMNVSICGGGSYLVGDVRATGISFGIEPLFLISKIEGKKIGLLILSLSQDEKAIKIAEKLRENNVSVVLLIDKSPSRALEYANSKNVENFLIIGDKETESKKYTIKNMKTGKEEKVAEKEILEKFSLK